MRQAWRQESTKERRLTRLGRVHRRPVAGSGNQPRLTRNQRNFDASGSVDKLNYFNGLQRKLWNIMRTFAILRESETVCQQE